MLLPYRWLKEYTDVTWSPEELAERLTMSGMEVSAVKPPQPNVPHVVVGQVGEVSAHPASEKLQVCQVDVGEKTITVVTGAQNVHPGMKVPVALPGAVLPGAEDPLEEVALAGVQSEGMMLSERELGVGDDASGIMELPADATIGNEVISELRLDDWVLEIKTYANRPDCQSIIGMAREVAALTQQPLRMPELRVDKGSDGPAVPVYIEDYDLCPRFCAHVIEDVEIGPSPGWLQAYLRLAGMRPINNVVDITNFVMLEMGQPLHAYDLTLLEGPEIHVRRARTGETLLTLDGTERTLSEEMLVIADKEGAVGIAGVMGGEATEISSTTRTILLEAATFNAASVRRTSRALGLPTEASLRFEKGLDPHLPEKALARAAQLVVELAGGKPAAQVTDVHETLPEERVIYVRPERVNTVLGTDLPAADMKRLLRALHFTVEKTDADRLKVRVPTYRSDIVGEVDLIEEIARLHGYGHIEPTLPQSSGVRGKQDGKMEQFDALRVRLSGAGLDEALTYSFMNPQALANLGLPQNDPALSAIPILNPIAEEMSLLRTTLMPGLLELLARNLRRQITSLHVYELGSVFLPKSLPLMSQPEERPALGIALMGQVRSMGWGIPQRNVDFYDLKGIVEAALQVLGVKATVRQGSHPALHPGRTAEIVVDGQVVGIMGEVHPDVLESFDIDRRAYLAEIDLEPLLGHATLPVAKPLPRYPAIRRDLALLAPTDVPAQKVADIIQSEGAPLLRRLQLFDVYQGAQVPDGYRSLAYSLEWLNPERTLTDQEIQPVLDRILQKLEQECGVRVRA